MKKSNRKGNQKISPDYAPGMDEALEESASKEEIKNKNYTKTVQLSYDEVDPS